MYSVDLKNIVPKGGLTCLFKKATSDESKLWHRRLGHLNFNTMNKLVKQNLVRGLPSKLLENDQTCVACQKRKQHRASCKPKAKNLISFSLYLLHMDLFGPTFVKSLMKKMHCLVVTDDNSRFTWVFFLATKDETSGILKSFITKIENIVDHKVKVIRCDNGTEFKNREMNQFCEMNGTQSNGFADQEKEDNINRTNNVNAVSSTVNVAGINEENELPFDPNIPALEDVSIFNFSSVDEDDGTVADIKKLDITIQVSPILTTRIHKDYPLDQVIGDLQSTTQTRMMSKNLEEHGFVSTIQQRTNHKDLKNCLFACFYYIKNPKR
nr:hypothetical protein [Tanacetum cinerariifolium]